MYKVLEEITSNDGRKIQTRGQIVGFDGTIYTQSTGLLIQLAKEQFLNLKIK